MWIFLFAVEPIVDTITNSVTGSRTSAAAGVGTSGFNSQRREHVDNDGVRTESDCCRRRHHRHVDQQRQHCPYNDR